MYIWNKFISLFYNPITFNIQKMVKHTIKIFQQIMKDFKHAPGQFVDTNR